MAVWYWKVFDNQGRFTKIMLVRRYAPVLKVAKLARSHTLFGLSAHTSFPKKHRQIVNLCKGWLHCFRDSDEFLGPDIPRILLHESDFTNEKIFVPRKKRRKRKFDILYSIKNSANQRKYKNYPLFIRCLDVLVGEMNLKILVVGSKIRVPSKYKKNVRCTGLIKNRKQMCRILNRCKTVFVPNVSDAGPRIITEGLCCDMPIVVNRNILGGWKYVNPQTGHFFSSPSDVGEAYKYVLNNDLSPRQAYLDEFGGHKAAYKKMYEFMRQVVPTVPKAKYYYVNLR